MTHIFKDAVDINVSVVSCSNYNYAIKVFNLFVNLIIIKRKYQYQPTVRLPTSCTRYIHPSNGNMNRINTQT